MAITGMGWEFYFGEDDNDVNSNATVPVIPSGDILIPHHTVVCQAVFSQMHDFDNGDHLVASPISDVQSC